MDEELEKAVIKTLAYSDIFDYPLRVLELEQYLIGFRLDDPSALTSLFGVIATAKRPDGLTKLNPSGQIGEHDGFFFLQGREKIVVLRQKREKVSQEKMQKTKKVLHVLKQVPFIKMVAVTGAVAAGNADENSDIDVLIVTQKDRFWLTRLLAILLTELRGVRRRPGPPSLRLPSELRRVHKNKFCLNMFISEENLELPHKDLFTANEFVRMKVVWEKDNCYERFIKVNEWVKNFLPNWKSTIKTQNYNSKLKTFKLYALILRFALYALRFLENAAKFIQLKYMKRRKTTELVTNGLLMFHPDDARKWVMKEYEKRIKGLGIRN